MARGTCAQCPREAVASPAFGEASSRTVDGFLQTLAWLIFSISSPSSFCWEHHLQQTVEVLQEEDTTCIIFMELVDRTS